MSPSRKPRSERPAQHRPIRVVPMRGVGGLVAPAARVAAPPAAQLTYRGGPLLTAVEVVTVYWGAAWNEATAQATAQSLNGFFQFLVSSPYIDQLGEYNTPQQKIGRGRYAGTARITDPVPGQGWYDDSNGEIGDVCAWQNKKLGTYEVQLLWSNRAKACV